MIKLIIFDLDGVLVETKDIHFQALNIALEEEGFSPISFDEHIAVYDGLPTKVKLVKKGIKDVEEAQRVYDLKQKHTFELLEEKIEKSPKFIEIFKKLKEDGYVIAVASNSIRYTVFLTLFKLGVMPYIDYVISNQDVKNGKPNPEMYLKCMIEFGVSPRETMIIEDSYVGRLCVSSSGAYLCDVNCPNDVSYKKITKRIQGIGKNNQNKWRADNMNVLIPMAGAGSRFQEAGYTFPKPLIEVNGKPMIQVVVENLNIDAHYIYIVQKEHYEKYNLKYLLEMITPDCDIIQVDGVTEGAACTTLLAKQLIDNEQQLVMANSDQWVEWDSSDFIYSMQSEYVDGGILTFEASHPKWSYAKIDENTGFVTEVAEKKVISNIATVGIYFWKKGSDYVKYAEQMIEKNIRFKNEFYVAPVFNEAIADGKKIKIHEAKEMKGLGTPEDLDRFLKG